MTPLEHALAYSALGWRVAPVPVGFKYPHGIDDWQVKATTDPERIRRYWALNPDHGICIATGPGSGIVAIDVDTYNGGGESWAELLARLGVDEPDTVEAVTGGGGRHLILAHPDDSGPVITNAAHAMPPGVDVRGEGGQIVVAPTIHPTTGARYEWEVEHDPLEGYPVAPMPAWLVELLRTPAPAQVARAERGTTYTGVDSIVDRFAADHTWPELLEARGWTFDSARTEAGGTYELWTRPGKDRGVSASLYYQGSDVLKVFTSNAAPLRSGETYTRFGFFAAYEHDGDHKAAAGAYRRQIRGLELVPTPAPPPAQPEERQDVIDTAEVEPRRRPGIIHNARQLDEVVAEATEAMIAANDPPRVFVRAGQLVRLRSDEDSRPMLEPLQSDHLRNVLADAATWWRSLKDGGLTATAPPVEIARAVLAGHDWGAPALGGVVELPVLRPDGTFALEHGYDEATRLYHWHRGEPYATVPDAPTRDELAAAVALVDEALCDFPWDTSADRANAWALLLTPLIRPVVGQVPMALVDAPEPGTGKGLLVTVAATITLGRSAGLTAWPASDEELAKVVTATLMSGATMIIFDNVEGTIRSANLAAVLTADVWTGRILGRSENATITNRATWVATGNNIDVGGDLARRCYRIRLDARQAQPWKRTQFRHPDLAVWVAENRGRLLHALCTIVRAWIVAGRPKADAVSAMGGYTSWVRTVGGILEVAGIGDFLGNLAEFHAEADREAGQWEAYLTHWSEVFGEQAVTVADVISKMTETYLGPDFRSVLPDDLGGYWDTPGFSRRFSLALRKRTGRHYGADGLHLVEMPRDRRKVALYAVTARPIELFPRESLNTPARADSVSRDDAKSAGDAGVTYQLREPNSYPQDAHESEISTSDPGRKLPRLPHSRADDLELF